MNRALFRISLACLAMFVLLLININYVQAFEPGKLAGEPGNIRVFDQQFTFKRGSIVAAGGGAHTVIAESTPIKGTDMFHRVYPYGRAYAAVTGYDSIYGSTGIEQAEDKELSGSDPRLAVHNLIQTLTGKPKTGARVYLTISPKAQLAAYSALASDGGHPGAAVAINPETGAILAMASYPTFNPNSYATLNGSKLDRIDARYRHASAQPLVNRAITNMGYPPGSTFKVVTSSAAFGTRKVAGPGSTIPAPTDYRLTGSTHVVHNDGNAPCANGHPQIIYAFTVSCNTAFAPLGHRVGAGALHSYATAFGMNNSSLTIPLQVEASNYPLLSDPAQVELSAIGQFDDTVTPLQEAMFAAAIADHGTLMRPYLVAKVQAPDLTLISRTTPSVLSRPDTAKVAADVGRMMESVTHNPAGTAYATAGPPATSINIAGKTGTAQNGVNNTGLNDAVFTCYAPAGNPKIAVGVIVQGGGFGAAAAAPIAVKIIEAYLGRR